MQIVDVTKAEPADDVFVLVVNAVFGVNDDDEELCS